MKHNIFTGEIIKIVNIDNRIQSIAYWTNKIIIHRNEEIKCSEIIKQYKND